MIKTLILDDEQHAIDRILYHLKPFADEFLVVAQCNSVEEAIDVVNKQKIDLAFLDIEIHDKTSFDFLNELNTIDFEIIFVTGFNAYAIEAFDYSAIHYLLKPVIADKFNEAINRLLKKSKQEFQVPNQLDILFNRLNNKPKETVVIPSLKNGLQILKLKDVFYFKADQSYCKVFTEKKSQLVSKNLGHFESTLENTSFFKIHKSYLVNTDEIANYISGNGGSVILTNGKELPVSKRQKPKLLKLLKEK
ncbi:LytR/AlgR family response regulator transcription factor [Winogradskyella sp. PG-2]|uniref:LytR/AlgR family response regulator transcription factor n=1 Tax=Winogradskyella sp. PG-2 TaxID=754409 RepID=UPI00045880D1|nr:LytTR family transcriptional regulator DNA-binding domain-containing protein [Winogradskyella sp. PG-2]BAO76870.1 two-component system response regulator protein [Winogradskyella sp. PG-2]